MHRETVTALRALPKHIAQARYDSVVTSLPIILLPGLDGTGDLFESFAAAAPPHLRPVVVPLPPVSRYDRLLDHVRQELPREGCFAVLGESFSGPLAIAVARAEPRAVAVILCNSFVTPPVSSLLRFLPWSLLFVVPPPRWVIRRYFVGVAASYQLLESVRAAVAKTPRAILAARMRAVFSLPFQREPSAISTPLLFLSSSGDDLVKANPVAIRRVASSVTCRTLAGPHLLLQAAPELAWAEISAFLNSRLTTR